MKIAVLTSSRADYSIYYPLLKKLSSDKYFSLSIIAFGTHLSKKYGYTLSKILKDGFSVRHNISTMPVNDTPSAIAYSIGKTISSFTKIWQKEKFDVVFALGDRYEMFAAVASTVPFNIPLAHIHGGETTLGAIDNVYRHCITQMSRYHFACTEQYRKKIIELTGSANNVYNVGALSVDNLKHLGLLSIGEFKKQFRIDLNIPSVLITFHPETVASEKNKIYIKELTAALKQLSRYQLIITMPNADTMGNMVRKHLNEFIKKNKNAIGVENFGTIGYLSCMKHCKFMLGNTSSAFAEASFFPTYAINLGERQTGRILTPNILNCEIKKDAILSAVKKVERLPAPKRTTIYGNGNAAARIISVLKKIK